MDIEILQFDQDLHGTLLKPLTQLLHAAYAPLLVEGMRYVASHQDEKTTLTRLNAGESYLAFTQSELIGCITLIGPKPRNPCPIYRKFDVYHFSQFAVRPDLQGQGVGSRLLNHVEARAKVLGATMLALDTAEMAHSLVTLYQSWGYQKVGQVQWDSTNYASVVMGKTLR